MAFWRTYRQSYGPRIEVQLLSPDVEPIGERLIVAQPWGISYDLSTPKAAPFGDDCIVGFSQGYNYNERHVSLRQLGFNPKGELAANKPIRFIEQSRQVLLRGVDPRITELPRVAETEENYSERPQKGEANGIPKLGLIYRNTTEKPEQTSNYRFQQLYLET